MNSSNLQGWAQARAANANVHLIGFDQDSLLFTSLAAVGGSLVGKVALPLLGREVAVIAGHIGLLDKDQQKLHVIDLSSESAPPKDISLKEISSGAVFSSFVASSGEKKQQANFLLKGETGVFVLDKTLSRLSLVSQVRI